MSGAAGLFVTGTDTEIGKTVVAAALIRHIVAGGMRCAPMKPVASGAHMAGGALVNEDALALIEAAGGDFEYGDVNPYVFADPVAPHIAAGRGGTVMEFDVIDAARGRLAARADAVVVEGVGGWLVPLAPGLDVETLARRLALPVVLVVGLRLGCINHALLSARAIESSGCAFAGWIANHLADDFPEAGENIAAIRAGIDAPLLAEVAFSLEGPAKARLEGVDEVALSAALAAPAREA